MRGGGTTTKQSHHYKRIAALHCVPLAMTHPVIARRRYDNEAIPPLQPDCRAPLHSARNDTLSCCTLVRESLPSVPKKELFWQQLPKDSARISIETRHGEKENNEAIPSKAKQSHHYNMIASPCLLAMTNDNQAISPTSPSPLL